MREEEINRKAKQIQGILDEWVQSKSILGVGERIVFSMRIESFPMVVESTAKADYWNMHPNEFFAWRRMVSFEVSKAQATRIHHCLRAVCVDSGDIDRFKTMRDFLEHFQFTSKIWRIKGMGMGGLKIIANLLHFAKLPIIDDMDI